MTAPPGAAADQSPPTGIRETPPVVVRRAVPGDEGPFLAAVRRSAGLIAPWNPVSTDPAAFRRLLEDDPTFVAYLLVDAATGDLAGKITVNGIQRGRLCQGALGYDSYLPYAGTGRMTEGLRLVVERCFLPQSAGGLGLHRVEVNVQPDNERSLALVRRVGFRHEGFSPRFLWINGAWRDHERFALTVEEWATSPRTPGRTAAPAPGASSPTW
jgi:ribosomal-protein-alanine N-acetyltransferase